MTEINADTIRERLKARRQKFTDDRANIEAVIAKAETDLREVNIHLMELDFAIEALGLTETAAIEKVVTENSAPIILPRELCAAAIDKHYPDALPTNENEVISGISVTWNTRTIRSALNIVAARRAKAPAHDRSLVGDIAMPMVEGMPDIPDFLRRDKEPAKHGDEA